MLVDCTEPLLNGLPEPSTVGVPVASKLLVIITPLDVPGVTVLDAKLTEPPEVIELVIYKGEFTVMDISPVPVV